MAARGYHPFPNTHWSLVHRAGFAEGEVRRDALAMLLTRYEPALLSYLQHFRRMDEEQAGELLQEFIADKVLEYHLLQHAQQGKGRFRTFLLTSLNHFAIDKFRTIERRTVDPRTYFEVGGSRQYNESPSTIVEAAWARTLIHAVLTGMQKECEQSDRRDVWAVFKNRILAEFFEGEPPVSYEQLSRDLSIGSPTQAANLLVTGKRMYARLLRAAVAEYECENEAIEAEIADLCQALEIPEVG